MKKKKKKKTKKKKKKTTTLPSVGNNSLINPYCRGFGVRYCVQYVFITVKN
jgi:hypothetical protein